MTNAKASCASEDRPMSNISTPQPHDVLSGRGGGTNNHVGNTHWRMLVAANKELYVSLPKRQKQLLSMSIVNAVRSQNPPGRFLQKDGSNKWVDIGDQRACEKTSQALREGAKEIRQELVQRGDLRPEAVARDSNSPRNGKPTTELSSQTSRSSRNSPTRPPAIVDTAPGAMAAPPPLPDHVTSVQFSIPPANDSHANFVLPSFANGLHSETSDPVPCTTTQLEQDFQVAFVGNGTLEPAGTSFGSVSIGSSVLDMPMPLESQGMSFGSTTVAGMPTPLEPGALSIGSAMSYTTTHTTTAPAATNPVDHGLEAVGMSIGSLSLTSAEQFRLKESLPPTQEEEPEVLPTLRLQRRSTTDLLVDSDSEDDDDEAGGQHHDSAAATGNTGGDLPKRSASVDYAALQRRLNIDNSKSAHDTTTTSTIQPLPLDRDVSTSSSIARFMSLSGAFTDQAEMERKSTVEQTELAYDFSGFSLDSVSGRDFTMPAPPPNSYFSREENVTDEERLAMLVSRQGSTGQADIRGTQV